MTEVMGCSQLHYAALTSTSLVMSRAFQPSYVVHGTAAEQLRALFTRLCARLIASRWSLVVKATTHFTEQELRGKQHVGQWTSSFYRIFSCLSGEWIIRINANIHFMKKAMSLAGNTTGLTKRLRKISEFFSLYNDSLDDFVRQKHKNQMSSVTLQLRRRVKKCVITFHWPVSVYLWQ